jgi:hypothetical protein
MFPIFKIGHIMLASKSSTVCHQMAEVLYKKAKFKVALKST